jgi:cytochrome c553
MKKVTGIVVLAAVAATASIAFAGMPARTGVVGSFHDMNAYAPGTLINPVTGDANQNLAATGALGVVKGSAEKYNRVCVYCHTPHNSTVTNGAGAGLSQLPLWNHAMPVSATAYTWATPDNTGFTITDPLVGPSRLCMSCHDGQIAVDQHGPTFDNNPGVTKLKGNRAIGGPSGGDVSNTHPIGFSYVAAFEGRNARKDALGNVLNTLSEIVDPVNGFATAISVSQTAGTYNTITRGGPKAIKSVLYNGVTMTCASCHEVHNKENVTQEVSTDASAVAPNYFLYAKEANSLICLSCHIK